MKSPFPGMDPYLERRWQDVHQRLCTYACDQLNEQLGKGLVARLGERLVVHAEERSPRTIYPDVRVVKERRSADSAQAVAVAVAVIECEDAAKPMMVRVDHDPEPQAFIEITEVDSGRLITVIEFLSRSNKKPGPGRKQYKQKQLELYRSGVNLVEVDLLRSGRRAFIISRSEFPDDAVAPYFAAIVRGRRPEIVELYPISLREPLPKLRIPLRVSDRDVALCLQPLIEQAYRNGRYGETNYRRACVPPLEGADAVWADEMLNAVGRR